MAISERVQIIEIFSLVIQSVSDRICEDLIFTDGQSSSSKFFDKLHSDI